jgi:ElaB/YqjD/DUF883 family membrane-anchored ribosome-binding protein
MADTNDGAPGVIGERDAGGTVPAGTETSTNVIVEFMDAARSAAESLLEEQKRQVAARVSGIAEALRSAAHSLDASQNTIIARYVDRAAGQVEGISRTVRDRRWDEIAAETEAFARRQPALFVLGAAAAGFLVGRLVWAATGIQPERTGATQQSSPGETTRTVTAAVASGSATGSEEMAGYAAGSSGATETR